MLPPVLNESCLEPFKFYDGSQILEAVFVQKKFYKCMASFSIKQRQYAYEMGISLGHQGHMTLVTVSKTGYRVWVDVQYQESPCSSDVMCLGDSTI